MMKANRMKTRKVSFKNYKKKVMCETMESTRSCFCLGRLGDQGKFSSLQQKKERTRRSSGLMIPSITSCKDTD